jgi:hypothetical protein
VQQLLPFRAGHFDDASPDDPDGVLDLSNLLQHPGEQKWKVDELAQPSQWQSALDAGAVSLDNEPALYIVRVGWRDEDDRPWQRSGVVGVANAIVSTLTQPATVVVNDSSFSELLVPEGVPLLRATDAGSKHYRVWPLRRSGYIETIGDACTHQAPATEAPFVLATADFFVLPAGLLFCLAGTT